MSIARYTKPYRSVSSQLELIKSRGVAVSDDNVAKDILERVGYYRLSAYWYPYRIDSTTEPNKKTDDYKPGADFDQFINLYLFDRKLRILVLDAIERVEVACRTSIALTVGKNGAWKYEQASTFDGRFTAKNPASGKSQYDIWFEKYSFRYSNAKEEFVEHFKIKYPLDTLPIWMSVELWDFGSISRFVNGLNGRDKWTIGNHLGLKSPHILPSWLRTLNFIRNTSAHHARLWNRGLVDQPQMPDLRQLPEFSHLSSDVFAQSRFYAAACILQYFMKLICPESQWSSRLKELLLEFPADNVLSLRSAGFPDDWHTQNLWN